MLNFRTALNTKERAGTHNAAIERQPEEVRDGGLVAEFHERHVVEAEVVRAREHVGVGVHLEHHNTFRIVNKSNTLLFFVISLCLGTNFSPLL